MARRRDYKAEYARRIERERERAVREDRPFVRSKARGHANPQESRAYDRAKRLYASNAARMKLGTLYPSWDDTKVAAQNYSWDEVEDVLRAQAKSIDAYRHGNVTPGRDAYTNGQASAFPIEFLWYHPA